MFSTSLIQCFFICSLLATDVLASTFRRLDEEESICVQGTTNITENGNYTAIRALIESDITAIMNHSISAPDKCTSKDGATLCSGSLSPFHIATIKSVCNETGGQLVEIENVRITCNPSASVKNDETMTTIDYIVDCAALTCNEDEIDDHTSNYLKDLDKLGSEYIGLTKSCKTLKGSTSNAFRIITSTVSMSLLVISLFFVSM